MNLIFLSPRAALLGLVVVVPLVALHLVRRRGRRVRDLLGLAEPPRRALVLALAALAALAMLLAAAAAQPVVERQRTVSVRDDAEAFVVLDISRSMLARRGDGPMRIERAKAAAARLRSALPEIPVGLASLTDRLLPHLFPSADQQVFAATVTHSVGVERPPPRSSLVRTSTRLETLASARTQRFFAPSARRRLLLVLTDGETQPVSSARLRELFRRPPAIEVVFVRFWHEDERVFTRGVPERGYRPDRAAGRVLTAVADAVGGEVFDEDERGEAARRARELLGSGRVVVRGEHRDRTALAPFLLVAALAPLALLLWRRDR